MTYGEARRAIYAPTVKYFSGATVAIANSKQVKKSRPFVLMNFGPLQMTTFPNERYLDGEPCLYYPASMKLEVQLFTNGRKLSNGAMENTAVGDLTDYVNFMMSHYMTVELGRKEMSILSSGPVQDVTTVINDANYEYRAMVEFTVYFTVTSVGYAGILDESSIKTDQTDPENPGKVLPPYIDPEWKETDSGGRNDDLATATVGYFTEAEISEMKE